jgi:O-acetyl-ADP-ribose deacetylase (regulator of RNase III)
LKVWRGGQKAEREAFAGGDRVCFKAADRLALDRIALPAISGCICGAPPERALPIAARESHPTAGEP